MTLGEYMEYWYHTYRMPRQRENTRITCRTTMAHILDSSLAQKEITKVTIKDCQEFLVNERMHGNRTYQLNNKKLGAPLSAHSILKMRQLLIAMFRQAVKEHVVDRNVAENTETLPLPWKDSPIFSPDAQRKFLQATRHHRFYPAYVLLFFLGFRRSELLGLSWDSIDFRRNILKIRQSLILVKGKLVLQEKTKTKASIRTIPFPKEIKYILQEWRERQRFESKQPGYNNDYNLVFTNRDGTPHNPNNFSRNFKAMIKKLHFSPELHVHSVRHTWATNMIQLGIPITDVQAIGGWSRPDTLLNIYSHTVKKSQRKAMKKLYKELL